MKRTAQSTSGNGKHRMVQCPYCGAKMRSNKLKRHLLTHQTMKPCKFCKKDFRSDRLLKHELLCQTSVDESLCDRSGVQHLVSDESCSSVAGYFKSYQLDVEKSPDYDAIVSNTCIAAKVF